MYLTAIVSNRPQGHRRLRFSFSSSLVKEQHLAMHNDFRTQQRLIPEFPV
jgi:hypothetical protein